MCPPDWFNREWLETLKSTELFEHFLSRAPEDLIPKGSSTCQGLYCMTPEGEFLSGGFAWVDRDRTLRALNDALAGMKAQVAKRGGEMKPVPSNSLPFFVSPESKEGELKLQVGYRDLPRGQNRLPHTQRNKRPVNLGFLDLKKEEVAEFLPTGQEEKVLSEALVKKISQEALKDAARGQCNVEKASFKEGHWTVQERSRSNGRRKIELRGTSHLQSSFTYQPTIFGRLVFDEAKEAFVAFDVVAVGQRSGDSEFNFRGGDEEAAPLGVAFRLFETDSTH